MLKPGLFDAEGQGIRHKAKDYFGIMLEEVRVVRIITIDADLSDEQVEQRVHLRLDRQQRLTGDDPPIFDAIIDEGALLRPVGDRSVMAGQLRHLLKMAELPNITVQVIPLVAGYHRGTRGSLHILEFADPEDPIIASVETVAGQMVLDRPGDLRTCTKIMEHLRTVALSPAASRDQLLRLLNER